METITDNRRLLGATIIFICLFSFLNFFPFAGASAEADVNNIANPVLLPNSPLYFLKDIGRAIQTFFVFDPEKKAELQLEFANQKLVETKKLTETDPTNTNAINKSLAGYAEATDKLKEAASVLKKDSTQSNTLLSKITEQNFNHQQILGELTNLVPQDKLEQAKNTAIDNFVNSSFKLASPLIVQKKIEENLNQPNATGAEKIKKLEVVSKMDSSVAQDLKPQVIKMQDDIVSSVSNSPILSATQKETIKGYLDTIKSNPIYKKTALEDLANQIASQNPEEIQKLSNISEADKQKLEEFAKTILNNQNLDLNKTIDDFNSLNLTPETTQVINQITAKVVNGGISSIIPPTVAINGNEIAPIANMANPASVFCVNQGYKIEIRSDSQGNQTGYCIFGDGKECEEWKFYRRECGSEYFKNVPTTSNLAPTVSK
jgi:putative hemolysin